MTQTAAPRVVSIKALLEAGAHFGHDLYLYDMEDGRMKESISC